MQRPPWGHEDAWGFPIDQGDRPVLHLGHGIALGVDVADLLELECSLQRDGKVDVAAEIEGTARGGDPCGGLVDERVGLEGLADEERGRLDSIDDGQAVGE